MTQTEQIKTDKQELWNDLKKFFIDLSDIDNELINKIKRKHNLK